MRGAVTLALWLGLTMGLHADTFVYVSMAPEEKVQVYRLDAKDGSLTSVQVVPVKGAPGSLAVDAERKHLYASLRTTSTLGSFAIDRSSGKLTPINTVALGKGENAAYVATDRTGRWLLSASYAAGKVAVHRLDGGKIEASPVQVLTTAKTAHAIALAPDNRMMFVPHVAPNAVYQFRFDAATGKLSDAGKADGGRPKAGPRHLAFHPVLKMAFSSDESGNSITAYSYAPRTGLAPVQTLSTLPADYRKPNSTAEVKVHPSGKYVWVSNRGHDSLAGFAIDEVGKLTAIGQVPTEAVPRSFEVSPDGRYVFGAGEGSGKLAVFRVETASGKLERIHTYPVGKSLTWVMAVELGAK